jgi:predicted HTH transcriptional regulator
MGSVSEPTFIDPPASRSVDSLPVRTTNPSLLDYERVASHIAYAAESGRYSGPTEPEAYLLHKRCLIDFSGDLYVTMAGLLCFGREPQVLFPRAVVDIGQYRDTDAVTYESINLVKDIGGTLFDQLTRVEQYLWANIHKGSKLSDTTFQRVEVPQYPRPVLRELSVNMIAHRDYSNYLSASRVQLFRDRIEWISPGGLPPGVTIENILNEQASRNKVILSILYEAGYVEAFGQGLDTVVAVLRREGMRAPIFNDTGASFHVTVYARPLEALGETGSYARLKDPQRTILAFLRANGEASPQQIRSYLKEQSQRSVQRYLSGLVEANLITTTGAGRSLRYQLASGQPLQDLAQPTSPQQ